MERENGNGKKKSNGRKTKAAPPNCLFIRFWLMKSNRKGHQSYVGLCFCFCDRKGRIRLGREKRWVRCNFEQTIVARAFSRKFVSPVFCAWTIKSSLSRRLHRCQQWWTTALTAMCRCCSRAGLLTHFLGTIISSLMQPRPQIHLYRTIHCHRWHSGLTLHPRCQMLHLQQISRPTIPPQQQRLATGTK